MVHYADPPILLRDVIADLGEVKQLLERNAPYTVQDVYPEPVPVAAARSIFDAA
jgi:hypothetical protein